MVDDGNILHIQVLEFGFLLINVSLELNCNISEMQFMIFNSMYYSCIHLLIEQISKLFLLYFPKFLLFYHKMSPKFYLPVHLLFSLLDFWLMCFYPLNSHLSVIKFMCTQQILSTTSSISISFLCL